MSENDEFAMHRLKVKRPGLPKIVRQRSPVHGYGVFAAETIMKNKRIVHYAGELIRNGKACEAREERYLRRAASGCSGSIGPGAATPRSAATLRGSSTTRAGRTAGSEIVDKTIWIRAARTIRTGEEVTYDYSIIGERTIPCRCRPACRIGSESRDADDSSGGLKKPRRARELMAEVTPGPPGPPTLATHSVPR
jgi:hypothetical protein